MKNKKRAYYKYAKRKRRHINKEKKSFIHFPPVKAICNLKNIVNNATPNSDTAIYRFTRSLSTAKSNSQGPIKNIHITICAMNIPPFISKKENIHYSVLIYVKQPKKAPYMKGCFFWLSSRCKVEMFIYDSS